MIAPRLLHAYRATTYRVDAAAVPIGVDAPAVRIGVASAAVRIGRRSPAMDAVLDRIGAREAGFITAWNPLSRSMPRGRNEQRQRRLMQHVRRYATLPAEGGWRCWHEAHLLVVADPRRLVRLARVFRQRGIVVVARHRPARLVLLAYRDGDTPK